MPYKPEIGNRHTDLRCLIAFISARVVADSIILWRVPAKWKVSALLRVPLVVITDVEMHTVPTGLASLPPPGPAMPLVAIATFAPVTRKAPADISRTTGRLTAPLSFNVLALTPRTPVFMLLL